MQLTRGASTPGVAFVALSRVRHPDHLVLDDDFPDLATIMKQAERESSGSGCAGSGSST